ncbi:taurine ABC transporter substrate-binding protein [Novosphingobium sp.]|uniref:taurine ABC transporter substrate-binding protein n=1 Tax=Novosphingobium sp. TaxID=1874826 RepID=UPI0038B9ADC0
MSITVRVLICALALGAGGLGAAAWFAGPTRNAVVIGYQTGVDPTKVAQAEGWYDRAIAKAAGRPVIWRKFDSGTDVITALAAGDIDFGDLGSSPLAVAATRQLPISTIALVSRLGRSEALVARNGSGIAGPADLVGRKVAVPFISTAHYSLLAALHHWGIDPARVQVLNLSPPQIAAAWARHDIDAAYVWDPALGDLKVNGKVLTGSDQVAAWGSPTFDVWVTRRDFAKSNPAAVEAFVRVTIASQDIYRRDGARWTATSPQSREIAAATGSRVEDVPGLLASNDYPTAAEQASPALLGRAPAGAGAGAGGGLARALANTAAFLQEQGKVDRVLVDYTPYIDPAPVRRVAQDQ